MGSPGVPEIPKKNTEYSIPGMSQNNVKTLFAFNNYLQNILVNLKITEKLISFNAWPDPYILTDGESEV